MMSCGKSHMEQKTCSIGTNSYSNQKQKSMQEDLIKMKSTENNFDW